jgi:predicted RNase H-like HicB family nuclease
MKIKAFIEKGADGTFGIYMDDSSLDYSVNGDGETVESAKKDFLSAYEVMKQHYKEIGQAFEDVEFIFEYDVPSFLESYSHVFSKPALEAITGINQKQFFHYIAGQKPTKRTIMKIQAGLHKLGEELSQVRFID